MADVWKSSAKHFCKICQCWLSGHKRNILNHERSERHVENMERSMINLKKRERDDEIKKQDIARELSHITKMANAQMEGKTIRQTPGYEPPSKEKMLINHMRGNFIGPQPGGPMDLMDPMMEAMPTPLAGGPGMNYLPQPGDDQGEFDMDEFNYDTQKNEAEGGSSKKKKEEERKPDFRFNIPAFEKKTNIAAELKGLQQKMKEVKKAASGVESADESDKELSSEGMTLQIPDLPEEIPEPPAYVYDGPALNFELPEGYRPPEASFYQTRVVREIPEEGHEADAVIDKRSTGSVLDITGGWNGGGLAAEFAQKMKEKEKAELPAEVVAAAPRCVTLDPEERLKLLMKKDPNEALRYQIEMESLGDRQRLIKDQMMLQDGEVLLQGDAGHLNRADLTATKKPVKVIGGSKGFKKRIKK